MRTILPGLQEWHNKGNGAYCMRIHYSADPEKNTPEWRAQAHAGMSENQWEREYEVNWRAGFGRRIYPEFSIETHVIEPIPIQSNWTIVGGIDSGFQNPFSAHATAMDQYGRLYVFFEHYMAGQRMSVHRKAIKAVRPQPDCWWMDRSALQDRIELIGEDENPGFTVAPAKIAHSGGKEYSEITVGINKVGEFLRKIIKCPRYPEGKPGLLVFNTCPHLIDEFLGYAAKEDSETPEKVSDHAMDDLRYQIVSGIDTPEIKEVQQFKTVDDRHAAELQWRKEDERKHRMRTFEGTRDEDEMDDWGIPSALDPMGIGV